MNEINEIYDIVNGIEYNRDIPDVAKELASLHNIVVIVGGSDDLMYCFGADSWLTEYCEHGYGWDGDRLSNISDKQLESEASQLGLEIYWCGRILEGGLSYEDVKSGNGVIKSIEGYDTKISGAFSYKVNSDIQYKDFTVYEEKGSDDVYCTGIIIQLPSNFVPANNP